MKICKWVAGIAGGLFLLSSVLGVIFAVKAGWHSWEAMSENLEEIHQNGPDLPDWIAWPLD